MAGRPVQPLKLAEEQRHLLEQRVRNDDSRYAERARIILCRANGLSREQTAQILGCQLKTVSLWTKRFQASGIKGLEDVPGRGRKTKLSEPKEASNSQSPASSAPINMQTVADAAAVSVVTVSRVLSNHPHVHFDLRRRVFQAVEQTGYQPDPELRKLMIHLRQRRKLKHHKVICSLEANAWKNAFTSNYFSELVSGTRTRAETLGFDWDTFPLESFISNPASSARILYNRGVEGILLLPAPRYMYSDFHPSEKCWERFSVVIATSAATSMPLRCVMPDYFRNMMLICSMLSEKGYRRIGLALPESLDRRALRHYTGAFFSFNLSNQQETIPPCLYGNRNLSASPQDVVNIRQWYEAHHPDVIIISSNTMAEEFTEMLKDLNHSNQIALAAITLLDRGNSVAGIDERPESIGTIAADALGSMIIHNEKGLTNPPTITMVEGIWREGDSLGNP